MTTRMQLKYGGISHFCLKYASVFNFRGPMTPEDVKKLFGHKFKDIHKISSSMETLTKYGLLIKTSGGYRITEAGKSQLTRIATPMKSGNRD